METDLRNVLRRIAHDLEAPAQIPRDVIARARRRRLLVVFTATLSFAAIAGSAVLGLRMVVSDSSRPAPVSGPPRGRPMLVPLDAGTPTDVALGEGSVWVASDRAVVRVDAGTGRVLAKIDPRRTPGLEGGATAVATGLGGVWIAGSDAAGATGAVARIDPRTNKIVQVIRLGDRSPLPGHHVLAVGEGRLWVATTSARSLHAVTRIEPSTDRVSETVVLSAEGGIAVGGSKVWAAGGSVVSRLDPRSLTLEEQIDVDTIVSGERYASSAHPIGLAYGARRLWILDLNDLVTRFDPIGKTSVVARLVEPSQRSIFDYSYYGHPDMVFAEGALWVGRPDGRILKVDPRRNRVVGFVRVGSARGDYALAVGGERIWVADPLTGMLRRLTRVESVPGPNVGRILLGVLGALMYVGLIGSTCWIASRKGRNPAAWLLFAIVAPVLALWVIAIAREGIGRGISEAYASDSPFVGPPDDPRYP